MKSDPLLPTPAQTTAPFSDSWGQAITRSSPVVGIAIFAYDYICCHSRAKPRSLTCSLKYLRNSWFNTAVVTTTLVASKILWPDNPIVGGLLAATMFVFAGGIQCIIKDEQKYKRLAMQPSKANPQQVTV